MHAKAEVSRHCYERASGFHSGLRPKRFIPSRLDGDLGKPRNFVLPEYSDFIAVAPWHAACHAANRQAYGYISSPPGQISLADSPR